jgi:tetratricopeptide (TPR) repeat protein/transcriptional regulator with XRE-family HTH domain
MAGKQALPPFKALLRRHRLAANLTQEALAERAALSVRTVSDLERGLKLAPRAETVHLLSQALVLPPEEHARFVEAAHRLDTLDGAAPDDVPPRFGPEHDIVTQPQPSGSATTAMPLPTGGYLGAQPLHMMVSREVELAGLVAALEAARQGSGRLILLAGEPGVGKTRLAQEIQQQARGAHVVPLIGHCYEEQRTTPYFPFLEALAVAWQAGSPALRQTASLRHAELGRLLPELLPVPPVMEGEDTRYRVQRAVAGFLVALATERPLALLLDDLHWADSASLELLAHLARTLRAHPVFLLGTYRDVEVGRQHPLEATLLALTRDRIVDVVTLHRLSREGTAALIRDRTGLQPVPNDLHDLVYKRTEGNPFFTEEILGALADQGAIRPDGTWSDDANAGITIPQSIRSVVGHRVGRLAPEAQELLRLASVLGQEFDLDVLLEMAESDEASMLAHVEAALGLHLLEERRAARSERCGFAHALIAQTLYEEVPRFRLRRLHLRAGEAMLRVRGDRPEVAAELARHFIAGGDDERATHFLDLAGDHAAALCAYAEAISLYRVAIELLADRGEMAAAATVQCKLGEWLGHIAQMDEAKVVLDAALASMETAGDTAGQAVAHGMLAQFYQMHRQDMQQARAHVDAALRLWPAARQDRELLRILLRAARGAGNDGRHEMAGRYIGCAREVAERLGASAPRLWVLVDEAFLQWEQGIPTSVMLASCARLEVLARQGYDSGLLADVHKEHASVLCSRGELRHALAEGSTAIEIAERADALGYLGTCLVHQRTWLTYAGRWHEAQTLSRRIDELDPEAVSWGREEPWLQGDFDGFLVGARRRLAAQRKNDASSGSLASYFSLSDALLQLERWQEAASSAREAHALLRSRTYWGFAGSTLGVVSEALARIDAVDAWPVLAEAESMIARLEQFIATPYLLRARGLLLAHKNSFDEAIVALTESAAVARKQESHVQVGRTLAVLADVARKAGTFALAAEADAERLAIVEQIGLEVRGLPWAQMRG